MKSNTKAAREAEQAVAVQRKRIVDEFGSLDSELAPLKGKLRRHEELAKLVRSWHADSKKSESVSSTGDSYEVVLSACGMLTRIPSMADVYQALGHARFLTHASVTIKALEQSGLDSAAIAALTEKEQAGYRSVVVRKLGK